MKKQIECDFLVAGAGTAGICAAIQAGRLGLKTILVEKEMILGGNAGPNLGVGSGGAQIVNPYWSETGIIEEIEKELNHKSQTSHNSTINIDPTRDYIISEILEKAGVQILRKHLVTAAEVVDNSIREVSVLNIENLDELVIKVNGSALDATGDAHLAELAGAEIMMGRESKSETGERSAPEKADEIVSAASISAITADIGIECKFTPPPGTAKWNPDKPANTFNPDRNLNVLFQVDEGGECEENHPLYSPQTLYCNLRKRIFSIWDHFKNERFPEEAKNHQLIWISPILGRRESRRIKGDHILTQTDIEGNREFRDAIGFGGHGLDFHPPSDDGGYETIFYSGPLPFDIPYRSIYSNNIDNLFMAGRNISASHVAFTTIRLQRTGGVTGQAAAAAAKLCLKYQCSPRELGEKHIEELQQLLTINDSWIIGRENRKALELATKTEFSASSEATVNQEPQGDRWINAGDGFGVGLYHYSANLENVSFYVRNQDKSEKKAVFSLGFGVSSPIKKLDPQWPRSDSYVFIHPKNDEHVKKFNIQLERELIIPPKFEGWLEIDISECDDFPAPDRKNFVKAVLLELSGDIEVMAIDNFIDVMDGYFKDDDSWIPAELARNDKQNIVPCFQLDPEPIPGLAANVLDGHIHRGGIAAPHQWTSAIDAPMPQHIQLDFDDTLTFNTVLLRFDSTERKFFDQNHVKSVGRLVADYRLEALVDGDWNEIHRETCNFLRFRKIELSNSINAKALRLVVDRVNKAGEPARIYEILPILN